MSVIESIRKAIGGEDSDDEPSVHYHCDFCDSDFETAYSFCPDCGSERITEVT